MSLKHAKKRTRPSGSGGKPKKKPNWFRYSNNSLNSLKGTRAFLITCDQGKERLAIKQATDVLLDLIEPDESLPICGEKDDDISQSISAEISSLTKGKAKLKAIDSGGKGLIFLRLSKEVDVDPVTISTNLIRNLQASKKANTTCCSRFIPLQYIVAVKSDDFPRLVQTFLKERLTGFKSKNYTYAIQFKKRFAETMNREETISLVGSELEKFANDNRIKLAANLKKPDISILVEVFKSIVGLSIVENMASLCKFNVRTAVL
mmetsp:Transcript_16834/g.19554  ORF Transcript_16834/g.19554 Transcript_16834/m.19554 type:complete len:262 (+) Transcript_16834:161-946(+)